MAGLRSALATPALGLALALGGMAGAARAHGLESSLDRVAGLGGNREIFELQSHFSSGEPAAGAVVTLVHPQGRSLSIGRTNAAGVLRFQLPPDADRSWEVKVDQGPGHRDYLEVPPLTGRSAAAIRSRADWLGGRGRVLEGGVLEGGVLGGGVLLLIGALALSPRRGKG